jgi:P-type Ca2+ transporter type 2C
MFLVALPRYGYSETVTRTIVFLYVSIAKLIFAYPARRVAAEPSHNLALHVTIGLSVALQLLTAYVPALRTLLGLEQPDGLAMAWLGGAVILSWLIAEIFSRLMKTRWQITRQQKPIQL